MKISKFELYVRKLQLKVIIKSGGFVIHTAKKPHMLTSKFDSQAQRTLMTSLEEEGSLHFQQLVRCSKDPDDGISKSQRIVKQFEEKHW